jgi:curved DNA-binding protein CbpA
MLARWAALHTRLAQGRQQQAASVALALSCFSSSSSASSSASRGAPPRDPYGVLNVPRTASAADIKAAFRREAMRLHPDRQGGRESSAAAFLELAEAFEALSDPARRRAAADRGGGGSTATTTTPPPRRPSAAASSSATHSSSTSHERWRRHDGADDASYDERDLPPFLQRWFENERSRREREREARLSQHQRRRPGAAGPLPWPLSVAERWFVGEDAADPHQQQEQAGPDKAASPFNALDPQSAEQVAGALVRCRAALQDELHSALLLAFFGPRAPRKGLPPGGLPRAFEAEERSDPKRTPELLHLVSGRTLLGVVRERRPPLLEGSEGGGDPAPLPAAVPLALALPPTSQSSSAERTDPAPLPDPRQVLREVLDGGGKEEEEASGGGGDHNDDAALLSWTAEQEAEVLARLDAPHALRGQYEWLAPAEEMLPAGQRGSLLAMPPLPPLLACATATTAATTATATDEDGGGGLLLVPAAKGAEDNGNDPAALGARLRRAAWDGTTASRAREAHRRVDRRGAAGQHEGDLLDDPFLAPTAAELALRRARAVAAAHRSAERARRRRWRRLVAAPAPDWRAEEWAFDELTPGVTVLELALTPTEEQPGGVVAVGVRHEDPWALRELGIAGRGGRLSPEDEKGGGDRNHHQQQQRQQGRFGSMASGVLGAAKLPPPPDHAVYPMKVFFGGRFVAACLDDVVLEPHTGDLLAAVYRMSTPGVNHIWFMRPQKPAPRLLARAKRGWLPPSNTWLFHPRAPGTHDSGGWYIEAEGPPAASSSSSPSASLSPLSPPSSSSSSPSSVLARPGYVHPAVFTMVAAYASLDAERRREQQARLRTERWERVFGSSSSSSSWSWSWRERRQDAEPSGGSL